jgi:glutamyl-tRNA synthetase
MLHPGIALDSNGFALSAGACDPAGMSAAAGRFAPSPTGPLHLGNLRTALLAWCYARSRRAPYLLRIEDLDPQRSRQEHEAGQIADLEALGIDWDGVPWRQSERRERHREAFEQLRARGLLYRCWCTRAEIRGAAQAPHVDADAYPGTCRLLTARERADRARQRPAAAWRLDAGAERVTVADAVAAPVSRTVDDFVVWRGEAQDAASVPAYNLAVVLDVADAGIGEVVRGDDLLATTPRQILLARLLGLGVPRYAHVPLVLDRDGRRLAKRAGAVTLAERLALGEEIEDVVGWMAASAGLAAAGARLGAHDMLGVFDPARIPRSPTIVDPARPLAAVVPAPR